MVKVRACPGFLVLDILLGLTILGIFIGFAGSSLMFSEQSAVKSGERIRGTFLSQQAIEAVRTIRDDDFDTLQVGTFGVRIGGSGTWELIPTPQTTPDGFTTSVVIEAPEDDLRQATAQTSWNFGPQRTGNSTVTTILTNWRQVKEVGNWAYPSLVGSIVDETPPHFGSIAVAGDYAFVTSEVLAGGAGLYVFDISSLAFPQRVAEGFSLGADGYQLAVGGDVLFVLAGSAGNELQAYDISSPDTLSTDQLLGSYNLPGEGKGRSLALFGDYLFVGSAEGAFEPEFYSFDVSDPSAITLLDSLDDEGGYLDVSLHNAYAYIGSSEDVSELVVVDVFDPENLEGAAGSGYNLTDVLDGKAVRAFGESILLGRAFGDIIEELVLFDIEENPVPTPPPGPWYQGIGEDVNALDVDPTGKYGFVVTNKDELELQVMDMEIFRSGELPRVGGYDTDTGVGRGVYYDANRDRLFMTTTTAFLIFSPAP